MVQILDYFHHIHHVGDKHEVHHCGGEHEKVNKKLAYEIKHCSCGKHSINKKEAIGHNFDYEEIKFVFAERCPAEGGGILKVAERQIIKGRA
jgi:hypothetical protein